METKNYGGDVSPTQLKFSDMPKRNSMLNTSLLMHNSTLVNNIRT